MKRERPIDWAQIELDYRAGIKTMRQMAHENGVVPSAIVKRAQRKGWTRDLNARVVAKAEDLVNRSVTKSLSGEKAACKMVNELAAEMAEIQLAHRKDIAKARALTVGLFKRMEQAGGMDLPESAKVLKLLIDALKATVEMERAAYKMDAKEAPGQNAQPVAVSVEFVAPAAP